MRRIVLVEHLMKAELEQRYRQARDGVSRSHWQILWLISQGKRTREIAEVTGYSAVWIRTLARRYNAQGEAGVGDQRQHNPGRQGVLNGAQQAALERELVAARARGEAWNGVRVAQWMSEQVGHPVHVQRGYEYLAKLKYSLQVPRPEHKQADVQEQAWFKKCCPSP